MELESALLDHAAYCRKITAETTDERAAHWLTVLAAEHEAVLEIWLNSSKLSKEPN
jgi:hypothetical protein